MDARSEQRPLATTPTVGRGRKPRDPTLASVLRASAELDAAANRSSLASWSKDRRDDLKSLLESTRPRLAISRRPSMQCSPADPRGGGLHPAVTRSVDARVTWSTYHQSIAPVLATRDHAKSFGPLRSTEAGSKLLLCVGHPALAVSIHVASIEATGLWAPTIVHCGPSPLRWVLTTLETEPPGDRCCPLAPLPVT